jgi:hypothetical protein
LGRSMSFGLGAAVLAGGGVVLVLYREEASMGLSALVGLVLGTVSISFLVGYVLGHLSARPSPPRAGDGD